MVQMCMPMFVCVMSDEIRKKHGFKVDSNYPVYAVDFIQNDDDSEETRFLLSDYQGNWVWVPMHCTRRALPPNSRSAQISGNRTKPVPGRT